MNYFLASRKDAKIFFRLCAGSRLGLAHPPAALDSPVSLSLLRMVQDVSLVTLPSDLVLQTR